MKRREPKFPWCTGAPCPIMLTCEDHERYTICYKVAPVVTSCSTATLEFENVRSISHYVINDDANEHLVNAPLLHDSIAESAGKTYLFFHNEYFVIDGRIAKEEKGEALNAANIVKWSNTMRD